MSTLATDFMIGFAFFLIIEGLAYALAPRLIKRMAQLIPAVSAERLRVFGIVVLAIGVGLVWLTR